MRDFQLPRRSAAIAANAMAATSHPLATLAALDQLRAGGNAVDAAVAAAAVLALAEPHMTGLGGDCFAIYAKQGAAPIALNGSGRAPMKATVAWYQAKRMGAIAPESPHAVTVPGAVDAWCRLAADHGTRDMAALLAPAIALAEEGCALTPRVASDFADSSMKPMLDPAAAKVFAPQGRVLALGERLKNPALAATMRRIAREGREGFYDGAVATDIVAKLNALGGLHTLDDFALQRCEYVTPIAAPYRGFDVHECPPNGQGVAALMILRVLAGYDLAGEKFSDADRIHLLAEATKAAYSARDALVGDPKFAPVPVARLLSDERAASVRAAIRMDRAGPTPSYDEAEHRDTIYLCVVDRDGNAISFINSIFHEFGSGIMAPESGVLLHSRGSMFRTTPGHPNSIAPGKRPLHTIIPAMLTKDGQAQMPFGVMGGNYQATGHAHLLTHMLDRGLDAQAALETPRSFAFDGVLGLERTMPRAVAEDLGRRGHRVGFAERPFGGGQAIWIDRAKGVLIGGSDPRKDGCALGY
ncbi:MAG TPA: gamma-glutamyltransferase [Stellaceae bacterium]|nr:gamma-glutamyltransferase [Stellaceae bacterium]